jgi:hypothetical protein
MVATTAGGTMNISMWRRFVASVAAIGVAIAMSVTGSSAPAYAADIVHAIPAALPGTQTMIFHAQAPTASGAVSTLDNPLDIHCFFDVDAPIARGGPLRGSIDTSDVRGGAQINCHFLGDGRPAPVPSIFLTVSLSHGGQVLTEQTTRSGEPSASLGVVAVPCQNGLWSTTTSVSVTFPSGYTPPIAFSTKGASTNLPFGACPNNYTIVPDVLGLAPSNANIVLLQSALHSTLGGSVSSCDYMAGRIARQRPFAGAEVLVGTTVTLNRSSGLPSTPCF